MCEQKQTTIRMPKEMKERLQIKAAQKGYTVTHLMMFIFVQYFQNTVPE